jgi:translation initiation factor 2 subunit 2
MALLHQTHALLLFCHCPQAMNRNNEHVSAYLLAELGTSGSLDGQQRLVVKGRFLPKSFETVLRRYVNE